MTILISIKNMEGLGSNVYRMMQINEFKHLRDIPVHLGKAVTVVCGVNASGKSTILSLLGHSAKDSNLSLLGKPFQTSYQEIMKTAYDTETKNSECVEFFVTDLNFEHDIETFKFRAYWNFEEDPKKRRYRVLPVRSPADKKDTKYECPVYYMGLSRLFPVGETRTVKIENITPDLTIEDKNYIIENHINILTMRHMIDKQTDIQLSGVNAVAKKKTFGIKLPTYGELCNSAGQDNVSQILAVIRSFEKLKDANPDKWNGGLFLIDEFDATLFPVSQIKLFNFLKSEAERIGLQVVITTHSLKLLDWVCEQIENNDETVNNEIEVLFLTNATGVVVSERNPNFSYIKNQLMNTGVITKKRKIRIIAEDEEAQWFLKELVPNWKRYFTFNQVPIGDADMKKLINDPELFDKTILLHDGDVVYVESDLTKVKIIRTPGSRDSELSPTEYIKKHAKNVVTLPFDGQDPIRPESVLWNHILTQYSNVNSEIWSIEENSTIMFFCDDDNKMRPDLMDQDKPERIQYKEWFNKLKNYNEPFLKRVVRNWITSHPAEYEDFISTFHKKYKIVNKINGFDSDIASIEDLQR